MAKSIRITLVALFFFRMCIGGGLADEMTFDTVLERVIMIIQLYLSGTVEYMEHYHTERPHQGIGNNIIEPPPVGQGKIVCHERLGGLLKSYRRAA